MMLVQLLGAAVLLLVGAYAVRSLGRHRSDAHGLIILATLAFLVAVTVFPERAAVALASLRFTRPLDAFLTVASVSSLMLCISLYVGQRETSRQITSLVRHVALRESEGRSGRGGRARRPG